MVMLAVRAGGPSANDVVVGHVPTPTAATGEVLVRVDAAGLNPYDLGLVTGRPVGDVLPYPPGRDLAGTVVDGAADLVGSKIWATGGELGRDRPGFHAEYVTLPVGGVRPIPTALAPEAAATIGVAFTTAWWALTDDGRHDSCHNGHGGEHARCLAGHRVLVTGAGGSVGSAALQVATWLGATKTWGVDLATRATQNNGALHVRIDGEVLYDEVRASGGATVVVDTVGAPVLDAVVAATAPGGRIMTMSTPGDGRVTFDLRTFYRNGLRLVGVNTGTKDVVANAVVLDELAPGFETGDLTALPIDSSFPLAEAREAYRRLEQRPHGKVVLVNS